MTREELKRMFPDASESFLAKNCTPDAVNRSAPHAQPQRALRHEPIPKAQTETVYSGRVLLRITGFITRPIDPDNLCPKYFIDCLRYAGIIKNDRPQDIELEIRQVKVPRAEERVEIEIIPL